MNERLSISESNPVRARFYDYDRFTYPWHFHGEYEIIYVKESRGRCFAGDYVGEYSDGELILLGSNLPHYMRSDSVYHTGNKKLRVKGAIIQFEEDFMKYSVENYPQFGKIKILLEQSRRGISFSSGVSKSLIRMVEGIPRLSGMQQITALLTLLQQMADCKEKRFLASAHFHESLSPFAYSRIDKIISYINGNYTQKVTLNDIASKAAMNPTALCRYFKENTGKTFMQYIMDMRIGYACKLLSMEKMNISEICTESGFESVTHFNRIFKRITGLTPTKYREQILE